MAGNVSAAARATPVRSGHIHILVDQNCFDPVRAANRHFRKFRRHRHAHRYYGPRGDKSGHNPSKKGAPQVILTYNA